MAWFRWSAGANILLSGVAVFLLLSSSPVPVARSFAVLREHANPAYAAWFLVELALPVALLLAALVARRTPWPWIALVTLHLVAVVAVAVRLRHWTDGGTWMLIALVVLLGLVSVGGALPADHEGNRG